ncbi:hypothetical protein SO802_034352 [Lithocarpus litseifolius]|uniref:Uncharacterized protein n=1 Tax=Lithocarpus litseifolius TaxID=425828 RepID=A0AAW2BHZ0_9ROSI
MCTKEKRKPKNLKRHQLGLDIISPVGGTCKSLKQVIRFQECPAKMTSDPRILLFRDCKQYNFYFGPQKLPQEILTLTTSCFSKLNTKSKNENKIENENQ